MKLVIIKAYLTPEEGRRLQSLLRSEEIESFLKDENLLQTAPFLQFATGGVKLQVAEADAWRAVSLLREHGYIKDEADAPPKREWWKVLLLFVVVGGLLAANSC